MIRFQTNKRLEIKIKLRMDCFYLKKN